ncbi:MAG: hypothetical protein EPGJADBJ_01002 [Saprospiraceae bacterium]|nr:hypothetical protein [Saprospiraceae bacterium]
MDVSNSREVQTRREREAKEHRASRKKFFAVVDILQQRQKRHEIPTPVAPGLMINLFWNLVGHLRRLPEIHQFAPA